ncbi:MAG: aminotransferase class I/II-fold pyridoxal phosphate-dependent enzyme [Gemmataceae bacterium]|nr:aminotransferase class I/II-fold pyridoxal phosphate-dependent enzyme [Gemmataceae bacterium]
MNTATSPAVSLSTFAKGLSTETAFDVLAVARKLKAQGKDVIELQIGDSPFNSTASALQSGVEAIRTNQTHYCPSLGLTSFRETVAANYKKEYGITISPENVVVGPGAKVFEQFFCEAFLNPGDAVLAFSPHFPTYVPNIQRRGAQIVYSALKQENEFRPNLNDVEAFVKNHGKAKAIFLNSPHNPTGGVATEEDLKGIADLVRGRSIAVFSDEPYNHMVWRGKHHPLLAQPDILDQVVACYTFSKSYSMSGWRLGYAISSTRIIESVGKMINTALSCVPPIVQLAGEAALKNDDQERDEVMARFRKKVELLVEELRVVPGVTVIMPAGTFYVFPKVEPICKELGITSHGLAMFLLEAADDEKGVACLGGECFGVAGQGFLRFSCAEPDDRLKAAVAFLREAVGRKERVQKYLEANPKYRLTK